MSARVIWALARADFLERTRRYSFFVTLLFAVFLGYQAAVGRVLVQLDEYRGVYTSGWVGTSMALVVTTFISLIGFYVVKNTVERDRATGVGPILAATPLARPIYGIGKWFSNFAVLGAIVAVLALAAVVMQFVAAEDRHLDLWALLSPFLVVALPAMTVTAAFALVFEMLPGLRGGFGNVVWFFIWVALLSIPISTHAAKFDPLGLATVLRSLSVEAAKAIPGYHGGMGIQIQTGQRILVAENFRWPGVRWTLPGIALRLFWVAASAALVCVISLLFDRFDNSKLPARRQVLPAQKDLGVQAQTSAPAPVQSARNLSSTSRAAFLPALLLNVAAELRLAAKGYPWWWYVTAAGLLIAQFASPLSASRGPLLAVAWFWPTLLWSGLGTREVANGTQPILFSSAGILQRQLPASWAAGILIALLCGLGAGLRLFLAGDFSGLIGWLAGAVFVPSMALGLGVCSGTSKLFEGLYTALWYVGPMNRAPGLDYTGNSAGPNPLRTASIYFCISFVFFGLAWLRRKMQLRGN